MLFLEIQLNLLQLDKTTLAYILILLFFFLAVGSTLDSKLPSDILNLLKCQKNVAAAKSRVSTRLSVSLNGHTSAVNSIQWSKSHG